MISEPARGLEAGRAVGADEDAGGRAGVAEAVGDVGAEVVGVTGLEGLLLGADGYGEGAGDDDAAFLALVAEHFLAGVGAGLVGFLQHLQGALLEAAADHAHGNGLAESDFGELAGGEEDLVGGGEVEGEEIRQGEGNAVEDFLQGRNGGADAVLLDEGNGAVGDAGGRVRAG